MEHSAATEPEATVDVRVRETAEVVVLVVEMRYSEGGVNEGGEPGQDVGEERSSKTWPLNYCLAHRNK